jgi:site-specific DNA-methyltransferase (adenine-specific)
MTAIRLLCGDAIEVLPTLAPCSVDSVVTDPPYGLSFMGKNWDRGIPGEVFWREALRVAKPGAHLLAFGGTRTFHRLTCAIEDAGWEIRDCLMWVYGSGFPKSLDVSKAIDRAAGATREATREATRSTTAISWDQRGSLERARFDEPVTTAAHEWQGWGTALKPAWEPIILARRPLEGTVAQNVQKWGTGALNIDGCRIEGVPRSVPQPILNSPAGRTYGRGAGRNGEMSVAPGRWPANLIHDGSEEVLAGFPESKDGVAVRHSSGGNTFGSDTPKPPLDDLGYGSRGSAARFFYCAKASKEDRDEGLWHLPASPHPTMGNGISGQPDQQRPNNHNTHPTVKPTALMQYLCRLVTPPDGIVLDPFMGSGSTGRAAILEGFSFIGIDLNAEYVDMARLRIEGAAPMFAEVNQ